MRITDKIKEKRLIFDGGMGTMLQGLGLAPGEAPERWSLSHPSEICNVHRAYIDAGCDILTSNTFGVNTLKYSAEDVRAMVRASFECMRNACAGAGREIYLALDIGPLGRLLEPYGDLSFEDAVKAFSETVRVGAECGADVILIETMNDSYETKAAVLAARENSCLPVFVTNVYDGTHKLMTGADVPAMVALLEGLAVDALGMNCSLGPWQMKEILPEFLKYSSTPIIVMPNAGLPVQRGDEVYYDIDAEEFAEAMAQMASMGACILGGCCGTTPNYIRETVRAVCDIPQVLPSIKDITLVSSYAHACEIGKRPILIGERINPTGKKWLKEALRTGDISYILSEAARQQDCGADMLDVNVGLPEIDEAGTMVRVIHELQAVCTLPLQIDTVNAEALEAGVRIYNGKPLINSVNGSEESMSTVFPIVKKYGGAVIALTMDGAGIPETARERADIAKRIVSRAAEYGIQKKDIIIDPLALTVSSDRKSADVTLEAIRLIRSELGLHTSLGVSNISFGLPMRDIVTATFYVMALEAGLDCAIMNPLSAEMMKAYRSFCALHGLDEGFTDYIAFASGLGSVQSTPAASGVSAVPSASGDINADGESGLRYAIIRGMCDSARDIAESMLDSMPPLEIINSYIIPALNTVGREFEEKRLYLPQLLMSAEASQAAFGAVKSRLPKGSEGGERIILATVKGDIHDIGKNIVKVLLENFGFDVIDLGRDVSARRICDAARDGGVRLVGLSALMTTTVPSMAETIKLLREECPETRVMVGGAVLTQEYADMIGADFYSPDAMGSVRYAQELFK